MILRQRGILHKNETEAKEVEHSTSVWPPTPTAPPVDTSRSKPLPRLLTGNEHADKILGFACYGISFALFLIGCLVAERRHWPFPDDFPTEATIHWACMICLFFLLRRTYPNLAIGLHPVIKNWGFAICMLWVRLTPPGQAVMHFFARLLHALYMA